MAYPRLDAASQKAKTLSRTLFVSSMGGLLFGPGLGRAMDTPSWVLLTVGLLSVIGIGVALLHARKVRCPSCTQPMFYRFAPTWLKPPQRPNEPDLMRCPHCYEDVDVSGGTLPPSNISLEQSRDG
jgi:hypothetical protein